MSVPALSSRCAWTKPPAPYAQRVDRRRSGLCRQIRPVPRRPVIAVGTTVVGTGARAVAGDPALCRRNQHLHLSRLPLRQRRWADHFHLPESTLPMLVRLPAASGAGCLSPRGVRAIGLLLGDACWLAAPRRGHLATRRAAGGRGHGRLPMTANRPKRRCHSGQAMAVSGGGRTVQARAGLGVVHAAAERLSESSMISIHGLASGGALLPVSTER